MLRLARLPEVLERAADLRAPNVDRGVRLRGRHRLQPLLRALPHPQRGPDADRQASWLTLVATTLRTLELLLDLLGIDVPERM